MRRSTCGACVARSASLFLPTGEGREKGLFLFSHSSGAEPLWSLMMYDGQPVEGCCLGADAVNPEPNRRLP